MSLREKKARKVRTAIFDAMLTLAEEHGYEAATIDQVAERAEVAVSTVYRYFANKDAILLAPVADQVSGLIDVFTDRPEDEDVRESLGHTITAVLEAAALRRDDVLRLRIQLDRAPGPRAQLWDLWHQQRVLLEDAIAARRGPDSDPLWNAAATHIVMMVTQMAVDHDRESLDAVSPAEYGRRILALLHGPDAPIPS